MESYVVSEKETAEVIAGRAMELRELAKMDAAAILIFDALEGRGMDVADFRRRWREKADGMAEHLIGELQSAFLNGIAARDGEEEREESVASNEWLGLFRSALVGA